VPKQIAELGQTEINQYFNISAVE